MRSKRDTLWNSPIVDDALTRYRRPHVRKWLDFVNCDKRHFWVGRFNENTLGRKAGNLNHADCPIGAIRSKYVADHDIWLFFH